jgi:hypothetical protein
MSLLDIVQQHLGPEQIQQISQHLGTDPATTSNAIQAALPMIVGGMAHTAQQPGGTNAIQNAVETHGGGGILDSLGGLGGLAGMLGGNTNNGSAGGGLLGSILGQHTATVQNSVQTASGLESSKVTALLAMLAPIVMAALAQHQAQQGTTGASGGLGGILQQAAAAAQQNNGASSPIGGMLGQILGKLQ